MPPMRLGVVTLFPELIEAGNQVGMVRVACEKQRLAVDTYNPRDWAQNRSRRVDDRPFGGGPGMLLEPEPLHAAIETAVARQADPLIISFSPQGKALDRAVIDQWVEQGQSLLMLCGRYEGIDQRLLDRWVQAEYSVGDLVIAGGELPAMIAIDAIARKLDGVVGDQQSVIEDSFEDGWLDHPHYTRPAVWREQSVPPVLLSGDHRRIAKWREQQRLLATAQRRADLLYGHGLKPESRAWLTEQWLAEQQIEHGRLRGARVSTASDY